MTLRAVVQSNLLFAGKNYKAGDIMPPEELGKTTIPVRNALKDGGFIVLESDDPAERPSLVTEEMIQHMGARLDQSSEMLADMQAQVTAVRAAQDETNRMLADLLSRSPKTATAGRGPTSR